MIYDILYNKHAKNSISNVFGIKISIIVPIMFIIWNYLKNKNKGFTLIQIKINTYYLNTL